MIRIFLFVLFFIGAGVNLQAQQIAKTNSGKVVVLFDNGTWKYADALPSETQPASAIAVEEVKVIDTNIELKDAETQKLSFLNGPSKKLKKYFKVKNIVNANLNLSSKDGEVRLNIDWKVMTGEGYSYFGSIRKGGVISLELLGGKTTNLTYNEEFEPKEYEKYGFTTYKTHLNLSLEQIALLRSNIVTKATMNWSKRSEEYTISNPAYFINELPKLIK